jgi:hypothetical protein
MFRRSIPIYYKRVMKQLCLLTTTLQINSESRQVQNTPATKNHLISTCAQRKMRDVHFGDTRSQKSEPCHETYYGAKETYYGAKETYYGANETYYGANETYYGANE